MSKTEKRDYAMDQVEAWITSNNVQLEKWLELPSDLVGLVSECFDSSYISFTFRHYQIVIRETAQTTNSMSVMKMSAADILVIKR